MSNPNNKKNGNVNNASKTNLSTPNNTGNTTNKGNSNKPPNNNGNKGNSNKNKTNNNNLEEDNLEEDNLEDNNNPQENNIEEDNLEKNNNLNKDFNNLNKEMNNLKKINTNINTNTTNTTTNNTTTNNTNKKNEGVKKMFSSAANKVADKVSEIKEEVSSNDTLMLVLKVILVLILVIILINIIKYFYIKWNVDQTSNPMLIDGTKNAKNALVISQDPSHTNYVPIQRSVNQDGIEFSYSLWFLINDFNYKQGEWKHIFHKGNSSSYPNRAPGVWIHPNSNMIRIYMNTMKTLLEYVDIDNIPLRKWVHLTIVLKNRFLLIYVNGFLKIRKELTSLPRQNYGNVWTNMYGGYEGYLAKLQYFDKAITPEQIDNIVSKGPGTGSCIDSKEVPPYLDDSWWLN
jgi:hypothetical protein